MITKENVNLYGLDEVKNILEVKNVSSVYEWITSHKIPYVVIKRKRYIPQIAVETYFKGGVYEERG